ncbi:hypothetical protein H8356DRAFT_1379292 [Neocallimastix lanati (nom. inval.)]|nr:hypothetical protein H8356DRAFT_1379292 [Neocallimastix sp. JGI-2020a]
MMAPLIAKTAHEGVHDRFCLQVGDTEAISFAEWHLPPCKPVPFGGYANAILSTRKRAFVEFCKMYYKDAKAKPVTTSISCPSYPWVVDGLVSGNMVAYCYLPICRACLPAGLRTFCVCSQEAEFKTVWPGINLSFLGPLSMKPETIIVPVIRSSRSRKGDVKRPMRSGRKKSQGAHRRRHCLGGTERGEEKIKDREGLLAEEFREREPDHVP